MFLVLQEILFFYLFLVDVTRTAFFVQGERWISIHYVYVLVTRHLLQDLFYGFELY